MKNAIAVTSMNAKMIHAAMASRVNLKWKQSALRVCAVIIVR